MFEGTRLFTGRNANRQYAERHHLAQLAAILGPPPLDFIQESEKSKSLWSADAVSKLLLIKLQRQAD
jgi:hypothetical protein